MTQAETVTEKLKTVIPVEASSTEKWAQMFLLGVLTWTAATWLQLRSLRKLPVYILTVNILRWARCGFSFSQSLWHSLFRPFPSCWRGSLTAELTRRAPESQPRPVHCFPGVANTGPVITASHLLRTLGEGWGSCYLVWPWANMTWELAPHSNAADIEAAFGWNDTKATLKSFQCGISALPDWVQSKNALRFQSLNFTVLSYFMERIHPKISNVFRFLSIIIT